MKPNYGFDAPGVIRWLFVFSFFCAFAGLYIPTLVHVEPAYWMQLFTGYFLFIACIFLTQAIWMLYGSLVGKPALIQKLVQELSLKGNETVLDVGCGRGLFLIEIAKRLQTGKAYGIDLWGQEESTHNRQESTLHNALLEGVSNRIELQTAPLHQLPFPDAFFDLVVSSLALHTLKDPQAREEALKECVRVVKRGGHLLLVDFQHISAYGEHLHQFGCKHIEISSAYYRYFPPIRIVKATKND